MSKDIDRKNVLNVQAVKHIKSDVAHSLIPKDVTQKMPEADVGNVEKNSIKDRLLKA